VAVVLVIHILAVVLFVGPSAVAASMFPGFVPLAVGEKPPVRGLKRPQRSGAVAAVLHRISRTYGLLALIVPVAGIALAVTWNKFGEAWLITAMILTVIAGVLFAVRIVPLQANLLESPPTRRRLSALAGTVGIFNLLWVATLVLMVLQPGGKHHA
jgi:hypothetical protein